MHSNYGILHSLLYHQCLYHHFISPISHLPEMLGYNLLYLVSRFCTLESLPFLTKRALKLQFPMKLDGFLSRDLSLRSVSVARVPDRAWSNTVCTYISSVWQLIWRTPANAEMKNNRNNKRKGRNGEYIKRRGWLWQACVAYLQFVLTVLGVIVK